FCLEQLGEADLDGRSVCVLVPDGTRSCPMPLLLGAVHEALHGRVTRLTVLIALGTHARMGETELARHLGYPAGGFAERYPGATVRNHEWWDPHTFASVGTIGADRIAELSEGRFHQSVDGRLNRAVVEHDLTLVVGPVFPHEVVGFSGGNKYLFPGVSSQEVINLSHWLGAPVPHTTTTARPGPGPDRRGRLPGPHRQAGLLRGGRVRVAGPALGSVRRAAGGLGGGRRPCRGNPRHLPRDPGAAGAVGHPGHVPRHVDGGQRLLQGRARRGRRRPGGA